MRDQIEEVLTTVTSGALNMTPETGYTYSYSTIVIMGTSATNVVFDVNGQTNLTLPGGTILYINVRSLNVTSGTGILLIGRKHRTSVFGN
jgi:hypothetical protein